MVVNSLSAYTHRSLEGCIFGPIVDATEANPFDAAQGGGDCQPVPSGYACGGLADPAP